MFYDLNLMKQPVVVKRFPWWQDAGILVVILVVSIASVSYYTSRQRLRIDAIKSEEKASQLMFTHQESTYKKLQNVTKQRNELVGKLEVLSEYMKSSKRKHLNVVSVEHLVNLKPEVLWFDQIKVANDNQFAIFEVNGKTPKVGYLADFLQSLRSTANQEKSVDDLRSLVVFEAVELSQLETVNDGLHKFSIRLRSKMMGAPNASPSQVPMVKIEGPGRKAASESLRIKAAHSTVAVAGSDQNGVEAARIASKDMPKSKTKPTASENTGIQSSEGTRGAVGVSTNASQINTSRSGFIRM